MRRTTSNSRLALHRRRGRSPYAGAPRGLTLIETSLATIIVGLGVLAMLAAQQAFHQKNAWSSHVSVGMYLGNEIREMTFNLPRHDPVTGDDVWGPEENELWVGNYDDLDDFNGWAFSAALGNGPLNARREIIPNMTGWSQEVYVSKVDVFDITSTTVPADAPYLMSVTVVVKYKDPTEDTPREITSMSWISPF